MPKLCLPGFSLKREHSAVDDHSVDNDVGVERNGQLGAPIAVLARVDESDLRLMLERVSLVERYLRPTPRLALAPHLVRFATAAMDVSDGLVKDCGRLAQASGLAAALDAALVPLSLPARTAIVHRPELLRSVLTGGDDYEVLAAVAPDQAEAFRTGAAESGVTVTEIGRLAEGAGVTVTAPDGAPLDVAAGGWDHFPG